ncbi:MAG: extracellular solute-binding protein [Mangrovicoccus sp.]|nr:extracellular solute-binding protein [Mangrovicoccus sp.]
MKRRELLMAGISAGLGMGMGPGWAACPEPDPAKPALPLQMIVGQSEAWRALAASMGECGALTTRFEPSYEAGLRDGFAANPAQYHLAGVSNDTITPLLAQGSLRGLDDLILKHGKGLLRNQLIRLNGKTVAIAMAVNTEQLLYRADILGDLGLAAPQTWAELLAAAAQIRQAGVVDYPLGGAYGAGPDLAQAFIHTVYGFGGRFFDEKNAPVVQGEAGQRALGLLAALSAYMHPDYLAKDRAFAQKQMQKGQIAMAVLWAPMAPSMDDPETSQVVGQVESAAVPRATADGPPATTLWWQGFVIAKNTSSEQAEAAFQTIMKAQNPAMVAAHNADAMWLVPGYQPPRLAAGAIATASSQPRPASYPSTPQMALMRAALEAQLPDYFRGRQSAEATLAAVSEAYLEAAKAAGFLK